MWAMTYLCDKFFASMRTTSFSESVSSSLNRYIKRTSIVVGLLSRFEHILRDYRYNKLSSNFKSFYIELVLTTCIKKIKQHALKIFTQDIFKNDENTD